MQEQAASGSLACDSERSSPVVARVREGDSGLQGVDSGRGDVLDVIETWNYSSEPDDVK